MIIIHPLSQKTQSDAFHRYIMLQLLLHSHIKQFANNFNYILINMKKKVVKNWNKSACDANIYHCAKKKKHWCVCIYAHIKSRRWSKIKRKDASRETNADKRRHKAWKLQARGSERVQATINNEWEGGVNEYAISTFVSHELRLAFILVFLRNFYKLFFTQQHATVCFFF